MVPDGNKSLYMPWTVISSKNLSSCHEAMELVVVSGHAAATPFEHILLIREQCRSRERREFNALRPIVRIGFRVQSFMQVFAQSCRQHEDSVISD